MDGQSHRKDDPTDCAYLEGCPVFARIESHELRTMWILEYCKGGESAECARFKLKSQGATVPLDLLPDGSTLED
jgi:hypothetical protein